MIIHQALTRSKSTCECDFYSLFLKPCHVFHLILLSTVVTLVVIALLQPLLIDFFYVFHTNFNMLSLSALLAGNDTALRAGFRVENYRLAYEASEKGLYFIIAVHKFHVY